MCVNSDLRIFEIIQNHHQILCLNNTRCAIQSESGGYTRTALNYASFEPSSYIEYACLQPRSCFASLSWQDIYFFLNRNNIYLTQ